MSIYLDANVLIALFTDDPLTRRTVDFLRTESQPLIVSGLAAAEFSAVIARHVRTGQITTEHARIAFESFDEWVQTSAQREPTTSLDFADAVTFVRRFEFNLRVPDSLHIAAARRLGATLMTFDSRMAATARSLMVTVAPA